MGSVTEARAARWLELAWLLLIVSSAIYFLADNEADNDLWVHLFSGRLILDAGGPPSTDTYSYTAAGAAWVDHEWLTQAVFALVHDAAGSLGLWLGKLLVGCLTAWLIWRPVAARTRSPWVRGIVMLLTLAVLARGFAVRPQIVSYVAIAALLAWLDREPAPWRSLLPVALAFALWANAHGAVIMGIGIVGLYALFPGRPSKAATPARQLHDRAGGWRLALPIAAVVGACLTPYGPGLFLYIAGELRAPHPLTEWQPIDLGDGAHAPFLVFLALLVATLPFARTLRHRTWWSILVAGVAVMAFRHQRHTPLLALCAAAPLAEQLDGALAWLASRFRVTLSAGALTILAAGIASLAVLQQVMLVAQQARGANPIGERIVFDAGEYPVGAMRFIVANHIRGNLALPLDWGGYALWHAAPGIKVSLDGRFATVYPPPVVEDNFAFFRADDDPAAARLIDAYPTDLVLMPRGFPTPIQARAGWTLLYTDSVAALFGKSGAPATAASEAPSGWLAFP